MNYPIVDLHCDLLCYLGGDSLRTAYDLPARCAIPQLRAGNVKIQTMAIFSEESEEALSRGITQLSIFKKIPQLYPEHFIHANLSKRHLSFSAASKNNPQCISLYYAFEGASTFCSPHERLDAGLSRLNAAFDFMPPLYISFTWNEENRFGGGAMTSIGLKEDGKRLLECMNQKGTAVDLSHASDALAWDILGYIDKNKLEIPIIASHSNARMIKEVPRNLPDDLLKEIIRRRGIIGMNAYRLFVGNVLEDMVRHIEHIINLGGEDHLVFGCDFFYDQDLPSKYRKEGELFFSNFANASGYPHFLRLLQKELGWSPEALKKIASENFYRFLAKITA